MLIVCEYHVRPSYGACAALQRELQPHVAEQPFLLTPTPPRFARVEKALRRLGWIVWNVLCGIGRVVPVLRVLLMRALGGR